MAFDTTIAGDLYVLGGDIIAGNVHLSPASASLVKGTVKVQPAGNNTAGEVIFQSKNGSTLRTTTFKGSTSSAADQTYTLPVNYPAASGYVLASTTGGVLSWSAAGGGSGTVGGTGTAKHLPRWATGGTDIEDTNWDATSDVLSYDDTTQKMSIDPTPGTVTIQHPNGGSTYALLLGEYSDTQARFELTATGAMAWGPGGSTARDVALTRPAANVLSLGTGDALIIGSTAGNHATTTNGLISYNSSTNKFEFRQNGAWINIPTVYGDVVGPGSATDTALALFDGTTGKLIKNSVVTLDSSGHMLFPNAGSLDTATGVANTLDFRAYATTGGTRITLIKLTNAALAPTLDFPTGATYAGNYIYNATGTDVPITDGGTGQSSAPAAINALGAAPAPGIFPTVLPKNGSTNTALASGTSVCTYLGKAPVTASSWKVRMYQGTAGAAPTTWAEVALCSGNAPVAATNQSLTTQGYVDISGWIGGAGGPQTLTISASFTAGDHMWLVIGENTTTRANVRSCVADEMDSGQVGSAAARPSTMGAGTTFTKSATLAGPFAYVYPN